VLAAIGHHDLVSVGMFNFAGSPAQLQALLELPFPVYFITTGLCTVADDQVAEAARSLLPLIPLDRHLVATNAPFLTPTNIKDEWLRVCSVILYSCTTKHE
jgi:Tat protein secretion system quality control protein TatD with DNase activity